MQVKNYVITTSMIELLVEQDYPLDVIYALQQLKNQIFCSEASFVNALIFLLGKENAFFYKAVIFQYTKNWQTVYEVTDNNTKIVKASVPPSSPPFINLSISPNFNISFRKRTILNSTTIFFNKNLNPPSSRPYLKITLRVRPVIITTDQTKKESELAAQINCKIEIKNICPHLWILACSFIKVTIFNPKETNITTGIAGKIYVQTNSSLYVQVPSSCSGGTVINTSSPIGNLQIKSPLAYIAKIWFLKNLNDSPERPFVVLEDKKISIRIPATKILLNNNDAFVITEIPLPSNTVRINCQSIPIFITTPIAHVIVLFPFPKVCLEINCSPLTLNIHVNSVAIPRPPPGTNFILSCKKCSAFLKVYSPVYIKTNKNQLIPTFKNNIPIQQLSMRLSSPYTSLHLLKNQPNIIFKSSMEMRLATTQKEYQKEPNLSTYSVYITTTPFSNQKIQSNNLFIKSLDIKVNIRHALAKVPSEVAIYEQIITEYLILTCIKSTGSLKVYSPVYIETKKNQIKPTVNNSISIKQLSIELYSPNIPYYLPLRNQPSIRFMAPMRMYLGKLKEYPPENLDYQSVKISNPLVTSKCSAFFKLYSLAYIETNKNQLKPTFDSTISIKQLSIQLYSPCASLSGLSHKKIDIQYSSLSTNDYKTTIFLKTLNDEYENFQTTASGKKSVMIIAKSSSSSFPTVSSKLPTVSVVSLNKENVFIRLDAPISIDLATLDNEYFIDSNQKSVKITAKQPSSFDQIVSSSQLNFKSLDLRMNLRPATATLLSKNNDSIFTKKFYINSINITTKQLSRFDQRVPSSQLNLKSLDLKMNLRPALVTTESQLTNFNLIIPKPLEMHLKINHPVSIYTNFISTTTDAIWIKHANITLNCKKCSAFLKVHSPVHIKTNKNHTIIGNSLLIKPLSMQLNAPYTSLYLLKEPLLDQVYLNFNAPIMMYLATQKECPSENINYQETTISNSKSVNITTKQLALPDQNTQSNNLFVKCLDIRMNLAPVTVTMSPEFLDSVLITSKDIILNCKKSSASLKVSSPAYIKTNKNQLKSTFENIIFIKQLSMQLYSPYTSFYLLKEPKWPYNEFTFLAPIRIHLATLKEYPPENLDYQKTITSKSVNITTKQLALSDQDSHSRQEISVNSLNIKMNLKPVIVVTPSQLNDYNLNNCNIILNCKKCSAFLNVSSPVYIDNRKNSLKSIVENRISVKPFSMQLYSPYTSLSLLKEPLLDQVYLNFNAPIMMYLATQKECPSENINYQKTAISNSKSVNITTKQLALPDQNTQSNNLFVKCLDIRMNLASAMLITPLQVTDFLITKKIVERSLFIFTKSNIIQIQPRLVKISVPFKGQNSDTVLMKKPSLMLLQTKHVWVNAINTIFHVNLEMQENLSIKLTAPIIWLNIPKSHHIEKYILMDPYHLQGHISYASVLTNQHYNHCNISTSFTTMNISTSFACVSLTPIITHYYKIECLALAPLEIKLYAN